MSVRRSIRAWAFACVITGAVSAGAAGAGRASITSQELREWLSYIASDELAGRAVFSSGFGLAAAYIQDHLSAWGVKPAGDSSSYLQTVRVLGVKTTSHASVTLDIDGESRTFPDGEGITLPRNMGGRQHLVIDRVEFVGYGLDAPGAGHMDFRGRDVKGEAVVWLGTNGPKDVEQGTYRRLLSGRNRYATEQLGASAAIGPPSPSGARGVQPSGDRGAESAGGAGEAGRARQAGAIEQPGGGRGVPIPAADFTTVKRLDRPAPPTVSASDAFFEFLFSQAPAKYDELKRKAAAQEPLPSFRLDGVKLTFNVDADYQVVRGRGTSRTTRPCRWTRSWRSSIST